MRKYSWIKVNDDEAAWTGVDVTWAIPALSQWILEAGKILCSTKGKKNSERENFFWERMRWCSFSYSAISCSPLRRLRDPVVCVRERTRHAELKGGDRFPSERRACISMCISNIHSVLQWALRAAIKTFKRGNWQFRCVKRSKEEQQRSHSLGSSKEVNQ